MKNNKNIVLSHAERSRRARRVYLCAALALTLCFAMAIPAFATTGDPLSSINKLSDFVFSCIKAIGVILLGFGIVQIGMSLKGHDPGQRANGFMCFFGGLLIAFAKEILDMII